VERHAADVSIVLRPELGHVGWPRNRSASRPSLVKHTIR